MTTYCKIENGVVVNRVLFSGEMPDGWAVPTDVWVKSETADMGWAYVNGVFTAPTPIPVQPLTPELTPAEKLQAAGLSVADLKALLGLS